MVLAMLSKPTAMVVPGAIAIVLHVWGQRTGCSEAMTVVGTVARVVARVPPVVARLAEARAWRTNGSVLGEGPSSPGARWRSTFYKLDLPRVVGHRLRLASVRDRAASGGFTFLWIVPALLLVLLLLSRKRRPEPVRGRRIL